MRHARFLLVAAAAGVLCSQTTQQDRAGKLSDGSVLLPTGWRIKPAGVQVPLDTLPMSSVLSRDGKFLLVLNAGYNPPSISVIATDTMKETSRVRVGDAWMGMAFSADGKFLYLGGGASYRVREFSYAAGELKPAREFEMNPGAKPADHDFIGDVAVSPDGRLIYAADLFRDSVDVINPQSGRVIERFKTGRRPYRIVFHPDGKSFFVSSWADATVYQYNSDNGSEINRVRVGPQATDMLLTTRKPDRDAEAGEVDNGAKYRLFVSGSNTNSVFVIGVSDDKELKLLETLNVAMTPQQPAGMTPSGLALNSDQTRLLVACSDANVLAVADISAQRSRLMGFVPTGWYPTAARVLTDGRLLVLNGRGSGSYPSTYGGSAKKAAVTREGGRALDFIGSMQTGSLSVIPPPADESLEEMTRTALSLSPYRDALLDPAAQPDSIVVSKTGKPSPIRYVVYVIKDGRTYDQVFGSLGKGNGNPSLTLFDETSAPNHYKLARQFVLFDNFYTNSDVGADGQNWSVSAIAPSFTQRTWPAILAGRLKYYSFEGGEPGNTPPAGYLWTNAASAGLSTRNYGEFVENRKLPIPGTNPVANNDSRQVLRVSDPSLQGVTNLNYRGFDPDYSDVDRVKVYLDELKEFEGNGNMPRLSIVRLANDRTLGSAAGKPTPRAMFADNDAALGMLVEGISKSRFWAQTAIFVMESSADDGADHVDSHRSVLLAISPYTRRGIVDSSFYNQTSVLRTMELILGMRPMTLFDAAARPLTAAFAPTPNLAPYAAEAPRISLQERNPAQ